MYTPCELTDKAADALYDAKDPDIEGCLIIGFLFLGVLSPVWYPIYAGGCLFTRTQKS